MATTHPSPVKAQAAIHGVLLAVTAGHLINDTLQALLLSIYPMLRDLHSLSFAQVGFITLVGLVSKNGILIVEFANHLQEQGLAKYEAIKGAAATRLRPVLMTAGATVLGHFPLVLVSGAGAEARNSIGIILVAGMLVGTVFTLYVLPAVYMLLAASHRDSAASAAAMPSSPQPDVP